MEMDGVGMDGVGVLIGQSQWGWASYGANWPRSPRRCKIRQRNMFLVYLRSPLDHAQYEFDCTPSVTYFDVIAV